MDNSAVASDQPTVTLLSLSKCEEDHLRLEQIFQQPEATLYPGLRVAIAHASEPACALAIVRANHVPIVICDADNIAGGWKQFAMELRRVPAPPCLILASRIPDDGLGADNLRQGVYEVLAKPLGITEVLRITKMAWLRWQYRYKMNNPESQQQSADSPETDRIKEEKS